jgi:signal peptidase I
MWRVSLAVVLISLLVILLVRRRILIVTVDGDSMWPSFAPGDRVLVRRTMPARLRPGQVVVVELPDEDGRWPAMARGTVTSRQWAIKRVAALPGDPRPDDCPPATAGQPEPVVPPGSLVLFGDNAAWSHDSRHIGYFPADRMLGVVVRRLSPSIPADPLWRERTAHLRRE